MTAFLPSLCHQNNRTLESYGFLIWVKKDTSHTSLTPSTKAGQQHMLCCDVAQQLYLHCILQFNKAALISMQCRVSLECPLPSWNPLPFNLLKSKYIQKHLLPLLAFPSRKYQQYKICLYILLCHFFNKKQICNNVNHVHQESGTPAFSAPFCPKKTHYFCQQHCSSSPRFFTELEFLVDHNVDCTAVLHLQADTRPIVYTVQ